MSGEQMRSDSCPVWSQLTEDKGNSIIYFYKEPKPEQTYVLDVNSLTKNTMQILREECSKKQFWILCSLSNNKVFCIWQDNQKKLGTVFSLDSQGNTFNFKMPYKKDILKSRIAIYDQNDMVYIFGYRRWYKLDIYRNIYFVIAGGSYRTYYSCVLIYNYAILSSEQQIHTFDVYDIVTNSNSIMNNIEIGKAKHLFSIDENVYAADACGYLFSFELWNSDEWKFIGSIGPWQIENFSYWLYCNSEVYIITENFNILKFDMKQNNLNVELIKTSPNPQREIHEINRSRIYEDKNFDILPVWKKILSPAITKALKIFWYFIAIENKNIGIFPTVLENSPGRSGWFLIAEAYEKINYFFELFRVKGLKNKKIIILISKPKKPVDFNSLILKINAIRKSLDADKTLSKLKKKIIVLSP